MEQELTKFVVDIWKEVSPFLSTLTIIAIIFGAFYLYNKFIDKISD